jgi:hypothetical protein
MTWKLVAEPQLYKVIFTAALSHLLGWPSVWTARRSMPWSVCLQGLCAHFSQMLYQLGFLFQKLSWVLCHKGTSVSRAHIVKASSI